MHVIQGGWVGRTYALATGSDAGGKKSRIRRSKEERKAMVESFIKKYQKSNKGDFPSLNLTHKEVGGSFYTVREIVREIIQENRVLAPPKKYLNKNDPPGFLEQLSLESSPVEHQNNLSASNQHHVGELLSNSGLQFGKPELNAEQVLNGLGKAEPKQYQETILEVSNSGQKIPSSGKDEFDNEKIVNRSEGHVEDTDSDKPLMANDVPIDCDQGESRLQSGQKVHTDPLEIQGHSFEQYVNNNKQMVDDTKGAEKQVYMDMNDTEILGKENFGGQDTELSQVATLNTNSVVKMKVLGVKCDSGTVLDLHGKSSELHDAAERSDDVANKSEKLAFNKSNLDVVDDAKDEENLKSSPEFKEEKVAQNLHESSCEDSKLSITFSPELENGNANGSGPKSSLLDETKVGSSTIQYTSEGSPKVGRIEPKHRDKNGVKKMDRINLETWKGTSKKSESNPVLALVKAFLSAFFKLWS